MTIVDNPTITICNTITFYLTRKYTNIYVHIRYMNNLITVPYPILGQLFCSTMRHCCYQKLVDNLKQCQIKEQ